MKTLLICSALLFSLSAYSQAGEELMVYSVKGDVMLVENNTETKLKIGKVLKPNSIIRAAKESKITMVCRQGKALMVSQEGVYPVANWKDSCKTEHTSLMANYFQYIWNSLYIRSPEGLEELARNGPITSSIRDGAVLRSVTEDIQSVRIVFNADIDTINYTEGDFPINWNTPGYEGKFLFQLFRVSDGKLIYKDSVTNNQIMMSKFARLLQPGKSYRWLIGTKGVSVRRPHVINCITPITLKKYIDNIDSLDMPEDPAAVYFRIGYMLEKQRYFANVLDYYKKAVQIDQETEIYRDRLKEFCREFRIPGESYSLR